MSQDFEELSDLYIRGELDSRNRSTFEKQIADNSDLMCSFEQKNAICQRLAISYRKSKLKDWNSQECQIMSKRKFQVTSFWITSLAACFILLCGILLYINKSDSISPMNNRFEIQSASHVDPAVNDTNLLQKDSLYDEHFYDRD